MDVLYQLSYVGQRERRAYRQAGSERSNIKEQSQRIVAEK